MILPIHIRKKPGTRIGQFWSLCHEGREKGSNGQIGEIWSTDDIEYATCAYCKFAYARVNFPNWKDLIVHYSVHPIYEPHSAVPVWAARCGEVDIENEHVLASRRPKYVTCSGCLNTLEK